MKLESPEVFFCLKDSHNFLILFKKIRKLSYLLKHILASEMSGNIILEFLLVLLEIDLKTNVSSNLK